MTKPEIPKHECMTDDLAYMPHGTQSRWFRHSNLGIHSCLGISGFVISLLSFSPTRHRGDRLERTWPIP